MSADLFDQAPPPKSNRRSTPRSPDPVPAPPPPSPPRHREPPADTTPGVMPAGRGWRVNEGRKPATRAKRVEVKLRDGRISGSEPVSKETPAGWLVETTRWTLTGDPFDVEFYRPK